MLKYESHEIAFRDEEVSLIKLEQVACAKPKAFFYFVLLNVSKMQLQMLML